MSKRGNYKDPNYTAKWRAGNKEHISKYNKQYSKNNPRNKRGSAVSDAYFKKHYGITSADYFELLEQQNGVCAICFEHESALRNTGSPIRLSVDHDHITGKVRGLLCQKCNSALGMMDDSCSKMQSAIAYLEKHNA